MRTGHGKGIGAPALGVAVGIAACMIISSAPAAAQPSGVGGEFQANSYTTGSQKIPGAAMDAAGNFVIVWDSTGQDGEGRGIFGQRFDSTGSPAGGEFQVNGFTTGDQYPAEVAMDPNGAFVVVWNSSGHDGSGRGIFAQLFDSAGAARGGEFQVNSYSTGQQYRHQPAMGADGSFVIVWASQGQDGSGYGVFARRFDSAGTPLDPQDLQVNTYTTGDQWLPKVDMNRAGEFVVSWQSDGQDGDDYGIFARRFDFQSGPIDAEEFQVNTWTTSEQRTSAAAIHDDGDFLVTWMSYGQDGHDFGIFARRYDASGSPLDSEEFQVNAYTTGGQYTPWVVVDGSGAVTISWEGSGDIVGRRFESDGTPVDASDFQINKYAGSFGTLAGDRSTRFISAWMSSGLDGSSDGIFGQLVTCDSDGDGLCDRFDLILTAPVSSDTLDCSDPGAIRPTFTWEAGNYDRFKVYMGSSPGFEKGTRVTSGDHAIRTTSWEPSKKKWKKACKKAISADPFSPEMFIMVVGKDRDLSKKAPLRLNESQVVGVDIEP